MSLTLDSSAYELPNLRYHLRLAENEPSFDHAWYDLKVYPYAKEPLFAAVGQNQTLVFRPSKDRNVKVEVIQAFEDEEDVVLNSCTWTYDPVSNDPLICVSGDVATIKVLNVVTARLVRTLTGSGEAVQDLQTCPVNPNVIASCGMDRDIRVWSLDSEFEHQPMLLICRGHREGVMSIAWHSSGRYLLSGGKDNTINLWVIPEFPNATSGTDKIPVLQFAHFSTSAIHSDWIDSLTFHGDLIVSKAARASVIVLWMIIGFSSREPVPDRFSAPTDREAYTRSAFAPSNNEVCFERLLQFKVPDTNHYWMRFGLFQHPSKHPLLVMGNSLGRLFIWDLQRLENWSDPHLLATSTAAEVSSSSMAAPPPLTAATTITTRASSVRDESLPPPSSMLMPFSPRSNGGGSIGSRVTRPGSVASSVSSYRRESPARRGSAAAGPVTTVPPSDVQDQFAELRAHKEVKVPKEKFDVRQIAFSPEGEWCVAVGDHGMIVICGRWDA